MFFNNPLPRLQYAGTDPFFQFRHNFLHHAFVRDGCADAVQFFRILSFCRLSDNFDCLIFLDTFVKAKIH
jgi:hypothetical protein